MAKNILLAALTRSFSLIWKNKFWFFVLLALQIAFFSVFGFVNMAYGAKIVESSKAIDDYLSQQQLDEISVAENIMQQKSVLGSDPLSISRNFNEMVKNLRLLLAYSFIVIVFFTSILWAFTYKMIHKISFKKFMKNFAKIFVVSLFCYGLIFTFFYSLSNISLTNAANESSKLFTKYIPFFIFSVVLFYFMFIAFSLLNEAKLSEIVQKALKTGIRKIHYILGAYFINVLFFAISMVLFGFFLEKNLLVLLASMMLMVFSFVFGRIFLVNVAEKLQS